MNNNKKKRPWNIVFDRVKIRNKILFSFGTMLVILVIVLKLVELYGVPFTSFQGELREIQKRNLKVLSIAADNRKDRLKMFIEELRIDVEVLANNKTVIMEAEKIKNLPEQLREDKNKLCQTDNYLSLIRILNKELTVHKDYEKIFLADVNTGIIYISTDDKDLGVNIENKDYYKTALKSHRIYISDITQDPQEKEYDLHVSSVIAKTDIIHNKTEKIEFGNEPVAVLVLQINPDSILDPLLDVKGDFGKTGETLLVNRDVKLIRSSHFRPLKKAVSDNLSYQITAKPAKFAAWGHEGIILTEDYRNVPVLAAYRHIRISPSLGWGMVVKQDYSEVTADIRKSILYSTLTGIVAIAISLFIISLFSRRIAEPIMELSRVSEKVASGNLDARAEIETKDELGTLAASLNVMIDHFRNWNKELEKEVEKRTFELKESEEAIWKLNEELERKVIERTKELWQANEELQNSYDELKLTQKQLIESEKMASLGGLVAGVAHEINTPVGIGISASSYLVKKSRQMLKMLQDNRIKKKDLDSFLNTAIESSSLILSNLEKAAALVGSFRQVAVDQHMEDRRIFNLKNYFDEIFTSLKHNLKNTGHEIIIDCPEDLEIDSYPGSFYQIITNFVSNSLTYAFNEGDKGRLEINVTKVENILNICYSDNGKGIKKENLSKVFDPFFTTGREKGGSGLGLHIVYNIVTQRLKGEIDCESSPGKGTTFNIRLPLS